jgi:transposase-like protein
LFNIIEQDHRPMKRLVNAGMGFKSFNTARQTLKGFEAMNMVRKGQVQAVEQGDSVSQAQFIAAIFGVAA